MRATELLFRFSVSVYLLIIADSFLGVHQELNLNKQELNHLQVLVVQEIGGPFKGKGVWKLPTGLIQEVSLWDLGSFFCVCVIFS